MNKTTTTTPNTMAPNSAATGARDYKVSAPTAAILDSITAASDLYDKITDALALRYDAESAEEKAMAYNRHICAIVDLLHEEVKGQLIDNLGDMSNSHSKTPTI